MNDTIIKPHFNAGTEGKWQHIGEKMVINWAKEDENFVVSRIFCNFVRLFV